MPSFGSLGKKAGLGGSATKRKGFSKGFEDDSRQALHSDDEEYQPQSPIESTSRNRSQSTLSASRVSLASDTYAAPPPFRRTHTTPMRSDAQHVKALYDFAGGATDELSMRAGDIIEVKKEISVDWWVGELNGRSGMFPSAYVEEYVPTPTTARPVSRAVPPMPGRAGSRTLPPALSTSAPGNTIAPRSPEDRWGGMTSESDFDHDQFSDSEHQTTASLTAQPQAPSSYFKPAPAPLRKPAPPPPPSRRSQSSSNLLSSSSFLSPPQAPFARSKPSSEEGSPFAGSEEDEDEEEIFGGRARSSTIGAAPTSSGLANGLGDLHLRGNGETANDCGMCGCRDFTQNVFKSKGTCSTCFHPH